MEQPINILLVDDEPKNLTVLETILDDPGYRLVRAESAEQALLALVAEEFALLILDIRMPGMTGFELAQLIKERKKTAQVPIIFLSAYYSEDQHMLEAYGAGAVDYLHKPVNPPILRSKVAVFAELHRRQRDSATANRALLAEAAERRRAEERLREMNETLEQRVTERTEALREKEHFLQRVTEVTPGVLHIFDLEEQRTVFVNRAVAPVLGYSPDEVQAMGTEVVPILMHPEDVPRYEEHLAHICTLADGGIADFEHRLRDSSGEWHWFHSRGAVFARDAAGGVRQIIGAAFEISERKRAEETLRESEVLLRSITDNTEDIIFVKDLHSRTIFKNPAGLRANALPQASVLGHSDAEFNVDRAQAAQFLANDRRVMESGRAETFEEVLTSAAGEKRVLLTTKTPRFDAGGRVIGLVGVAHDITERKRAEEVLRLSLHEKEVLLREIHHRVKNNLQIVSSLLNLQSRRLSDPALLAVFASTRDRVRAMAAVHEQLYESGDFATIHLGQHLGKLARILMRAQTPEGAAIQPVLQCDPVTVDLSTAVPLSLIASELITNALKYAFAGRREGSLTIGLRADGGHCELRIADDGSGLPAAVDPATTPTLGLRLVRDLSRQIRGELVIDSTAAGTNIAVRWPARHTPGDAPAPSPPDEPQKA